MWMIKNWPGLLTGSEFIDIREYTCRQPKSLPLYWQIWWQVVSLFWNGDRKYAPQSHPQLSLLDWIETCQKWAKPNLSRGYPPKWFFSKKECEYHVVFRTDGKLGQYRDVHWLHPLHPARPEESHAPLTWNCLFKNIKRNLVKSRRRTDQLKVFCRLCF